VDAFGHVSNGEIFLHGMHIAEYTQGTWTNHEPRRTRKLLLNRIEIARLVGKLQESGLTIVPLSVYFSDGWAKVELGLARGKKSYDKRQDLAKRDADREIQKAVGRRGKGME
jgi:SsrA-binding protein